MQFLFLDFETYWSDDYTLKKMTPIEYVMDPRFEALGCAFGVLGDRVTAPKPDVWFDGPQLPGLFKSIDWGQTYAISHNALFDMLVLSARYGVRPKMYGDTLSMARNWIQHSTGRVSLDACSKFLGFGDKMLTVTKTKGISYEVLRRMPELHKEVQEYAIDDMGKCRSIFLHLMNDGFPPRELRVIDWVVKMAAQPTLEFDPLLLAEHLAEVKAAKAALLERAGLDNRDNLMRDSALAAMLLFAGATPPMKISKATGKEQFAFAKTDKEFTALLDHESEDVQAIVAARLGHKSTIEETRTERLIKIAQVSPQVPVPLKYSGAHTHRFSGDWSINLQNLRRGGKLRKALRAPKGHVIVSVDASQIEARFNATLSKQFDLMEQFRQGQDVYAKFAETIYHYPIDKKLHPVERFVGKTGILSLGYGSSGPVFQNMCRVQSDGKVLLTDSEASSIVHLYRNSYRQIVLDWDYADKVVLPAISSGSVIGNWGPIEVRQYKLCLPNGNYLRYRDLHSEWIGTRLQWMFMRGQVPIHTYGAKLVENVIQALAFVHIVDVALKVMDMTDGMLWPAHQVHDELLYVVDEKLAQQVAALVKAEMAKSPVWMPDAPLAAESAIGPTYGDTK